MEPIEKLLLTLYQSKDETYRDVFTSSEDKHDIYILNSLYGLKIFIKQINAEDILIDFYEELSNSKKPTHSQVVKLEDVKDFFRILHEEESLLKNRNTILRIGKEKYNTAYKLDMDFLKGLNCDDFNILEIKREENNNYSEIDYKLEINKQLKSDKEELVTSLYVTKGLNKDLPLDKITITASHIVRDTEGTLTAVHNTYIIPMFEVENYPFLNQHIQYKPKKIDLLSNLTKENKKLRNMLLFLDMDNNLPSKDKKTKKNKL